MKNKQGISLIVLVITIIITVILASAVIITLTNTGIIGTAQNAVERTNEQQLSMDVSHYLVMNGWRNDENNTAESFENYLRSMPNLTSVTKVASDAWEINREGTKIVVYQSGKTAANMSVWDGTSSEVPEAKEGNWYIYTVAQLKFFADAVANKGLTATQTTLIEQAGFEVADYTMDSNTVVHLMANMDLGARHNKGTYVSGPKWTPIGDGQKFLGKIDGHDHYITGMYIDYNKNYAAFICYVQEVSNLTIKDGYVKTSKGCAGGIAGIVTTITDCHNINTSVVQTGSYAVGGLAGQVNSSIIRCTNSGSVSTAATSAGGLTALLASSGTIIDSTNTGTVTAKLQTAGGIVGNPKDNCIITNCDNKGDIFAGNKSDTTKESAQVGGIVGVTGKSNQINNCNNFGSIKGEKKYTGGIVGAQSKSSNILLCTNAGSVEGTQYTGGIIGYFDESVSIKSCENTGSIKGADVVGGISGFLNDFGQIQLCTNSGDVSGSQRVGGITGGTDLSANIKTSRNEGYITATSMKLGGIAGEINISTIIEQCSNNGTIEMSKTGEGVGGIVGLVATDQAEPSEAVPNKILYCYNEGLVKGGKIYTGGICGVMTQYKSSIEKSYNIGEVQGQSYVGGIVGNLLYGAQVINCYNANIVTGTSNVGGIVGSTFGFGITARNITNVYNIAVITGTSDVGGIIGSSNNTTITNACYLTGTADVGVGDKTETNLAQTAEYIKTTFLTTADTTGTIWEIRENENANYPVLVKP